MHNVQAYRTGLPGVEVFQLTSDRHFPRHSHDQFGIGVIDQGVQHSWSGFGWVDGGPGDIITVNPGEMHDGLPIDGKERSWRMVYLDPAYVLKLLDDDRRIDAAVLFPCVSDSDYAALFSSVYKVLATDSSDAEQCHEGLLRLVACAFDLHSTDRPVKPSTLPDISKIKQVLDGAPERPYTLQQMADETGTTKFKFLRAFRAATGATPHAYLTQQRVRLARKLISGRQSLPDVGLAAGFADQSHMTRAFVRQLGVTPARYRAAVCD